MIQKNNSIKDILGLIEQIQCEDCMPKNIRLKLKEVYGLLCTEEGTLAIKVDKSIQELDDIAEDQFVPMHIRTQIWSIVSRLECI